MTVPRGIRNRCTKQQQIRAMVDAIREILGLSPLYCDTPAHRINSQPSAYALEADLLNGRGGRRGQS